VLELKIVNTLTKYFFDKPRPEQYFLHRGSFIFQIAASQQQNWLVLIAKRQEPQILLNHTYYDEG